MIHVIRHYQLLEEIYTQYINRIHKDVNDLLSVVIILVTDVHGGKKVFLNVITMNDIGKKSHVLKHSHGGCVVGFLDKNLHELSIWNRPRSVLSFILHKSIFLHFVHHGKKIYEKYINTDDRTNILMMMGVVFFQNKRLEIFIIRNIRRHVEIDVMFFPPHI